ncbi:hypothetical protein C2G38_2156858 [Gigaspora rosea]|uniref:Uncharacterized protein n=1 Tax=Gigaspora rosea TaxID=44941 RepID=A0A397WAW7_9GLOM|nr:hypothetical protein C2G38_2156858 [Gigaspora rosea]
MPWTNLSSISGVTCKTGATVCADETTIYYIGGLHNGGLVSKFNTISLQWCESTTSGSIPIEEIKFVHCAILRHNIYIYAGYAVHKMNILDTSKLFWSIFTSSLIYSGTYLYSATLLNDSILYIGGKFHSLDGCQTNSNQEASLNAPYKDQTFNNVHLERSEYIFEPEFAMRHTATLIGAYVLIAFGFYLTDEGRFTSSDIFLLDVSHKDSYKWVTTYDPINSIQPIPTSPISPTSPTPPLNINIGTVIAGAIGLLIIGMIIGSVITGLLRSIIERTNINRVNYDRLP